jgi:hypothetical protein
MEGAESAAATLEAVPGSGVNAEGGGGGGGGGAKRKPAGGGGDDDAVPAKKHAPSTTSQAQDLADKLTAAADTSRAATERAGKAAAEAAERTAAKVEERMHAAMARGNDERLKKAEKQLVAERANMERARGAKEAAEAKALAAGVTPVDLAKLDTTAGKKAFQAKAAASPGVKGGASGGRPTVTLATGGQKSAADILREPECPTEVLPQDMLTYTGDPSDRHKLMAWKKEVESFKERVGRDRDKYVLKRRKEVREAAVKEGVAAFKLIAEVGKHIEAVERAEAGVIKVEQFLASLEEKREQLKETIVYKAALAKERVEAKNAMAIVALEDKLAKLSDRKIDEANAAVERDRVKEAAKLGREATRQAEKAERDRIKEQDKADRAAAREAERLGREKVKEDERLAKEREAKYPIDDTLLAAEFEAEAAAAGVPVASLYTPLPEPTPMEDGALVAEEAALLDFLHVFGATLEVPKGLGSCSAKDLRAVILGCGPKLGALYRALLAPSLEVSASGKGHNAARWRRVNADATWPEVVRRVLERKKAGAAGAAALGARAWQRLSPGEHTLALRGLADVALNSDGLRSVIEGRLEAAGELRTARIEERNADAASRRATEHKAKEKRKAFREKEAARRRAEKEAKRVAREAALAAGKEVEEEEEEEEEDDEEEEEEEEAEAGDDEEEGEDADGDDAGGYRADPSAEDDVKMEEEKAANPAVSTARPTAVRGGKREAEAEGFVDAEAELTFELPQHLVEYDGHPDDRKALMAWRAESARMSQQLAVDKREYEKRKKAEARREIEREKFEKMRVLEEANRETKREEAKRDEAKRAEEAKEKLLRKKETGRMAEDARVAVRVKPLGQDRHHRTYWWGVGGVKAAVYVEDAGGMWGVLSTYKEVDALVDALHHWGDRERALKHALARRVHTLAAEFRKEAKERGDDDADVTCRAASGYLKREGAAAGTGMGLGPGGTPGGNADESLPLSSAREFMEEMCVAAEGASLANADYYHGRGGVGGSVGGSENPSAAWRNFKARVCAARDKPRVSALLLELEEALFAIQRVEFMPAKQVAARVAARDAGEAYESDSSDDEEDDDDDDDDFVRRDDDEVPKQTHEEKVSSGLVYPIWHTKHERKAWRAGLTKKATVASVAFAAAVLEDAAGLFLRAVTHRSEPVHNEVAGGMGASKDTGPGEAEG